MHKKTLKIVLQVIEPCHNLPSKSQFLMWVQHVFDECSITQPYALTIRVVSKSEIHQLNKKYRKCDAPTNILSFEDEFIPGCPRESLGELIVCPMLIEKEAAIEKKPLFAYWAHIIIHGVLHLLGYTHDITTDAEEMEALEAKILKQINVNP
jgi:probable rRNA maturation factor